MALNPKFLDLERIGFQCRGKQSELDLYQKCYSYEGYTNLFWVQIFLLEYLEPLWILNISVANACKFLWCIETELSLRQCFFSIFKNISNVGFYIQRKGWIKPCDLPYSDLFLTIFVFIFQFFIKTTVA